MLIFERQGAPIQASVTFGAFAATDDVAQIRHPDGYVNGQGELVVHVYAPLFPWSFRLRVRERGAIVFDRTFGSEVDLLASGQDREVIVAL